MKEVNYQCFIDSITIRYNNLRLEELYKDDYICFIHKKSLVFKDKKTNNILFNVKTRTDSTGLEYQLLSFNGFKKYSSRDEEILKTFNKIIQLLNDNDIHFFLSKIDLAIDFYNVKLEDLDIERKKCVGVRRQLLSNLNVEEKENIVENIETFYFEKLAKSKRKQRGYLYNKSKKEKIKKSIYRFEVELINFNVIEKSSLNTYNDLVLLEIKRRFNKYLVKCMYQQISFDYSIVKDILLKCNRL